MDIFLKGIKHDYASCQVVENIPTWKVTSLELQKVENVGLDLFSFWVPQRSMKSDKFQGYWVTPSAYVQLSTGKAVLYFREAQEEVCALSPSPSSDGYANNIMAHANKPLMTNVNIGWCHLICACPFWHIKQGVNWHLQWRRGQGVGYKATTEFLPPSLPPSLSPLPEELSGTRYQGSHHSLAELLRSLVTPSQPQLWIMRCSGIWVMCFSWLLFPNVLVQQASKRSELPQTSILPRLQVKSYPPSKPPFLLFCFSFFSLRAMSNERKSMCIRYKVYGGF